jgi:DNA polymerase
MKRMHVDIETYSAADLSDVGVYRYVDDPSFEVLLIAYSVDDGPVKVIDEMTMTSEDTERHIEFFELLVDPTVTKYAYNAAFERTCLAKWALEPMPPEQWRCTMVHALMCGLPGSLAAIGDALGLPEDKLKDKQGKALIDYFCKPCKPTKTNGGRVRNLPAHDPDKWRLFIEYNRQDVVTEMEIERRLDSIYKVPEREQILWQLDQQINDCGIRIDCGLVWSITDYNEERTKELQEESKRITGLSNPNSLAQLKDWLQKQEPGVDFTTLRKEDLDELLQMGLNDKVRRVLEIRQACGKTSTAKYNKMDAMVCSDGRIRGTLQFYGASRSGRWGGRGVQVHNLARNSLPDLDLARELVADEDFDTLQTLYGETSFVFSELVRTAFIPSAGNKFVVSDFSAIEARVVAWVAGEEWVLDAFRNGEDIYCKTASMMYHVPVEKHGQNAELRQRGKVACLACGYQGGISAMRAMDTTGTIPDEELQSVVDQWRSANPNIVKLWRSVELAAKTAIEDHKMHTIRRGISFSYRNYNLYITLPSGRSLVYFGAKLKDGKYGDQIVYKGLNQTTKKWEDTETYGGKLVENIVQGIARDCLAEAMTRVADKGYQIVMHVHDEMIVDVPGEEADPALTLINEMMGKEIEWAPGLPLKGDGYVCEFYKKD